MKPPKVTTNIRKWRRRLVGRMADFVDVNMHDVKNYHLIIRVVQDELWGPGRTVIVLLGQSGRVNSIFVHDSELDAWLWNESTIFMFVGSLHDFDLEIYAGLRVLEKK